MNASNPISQALILFAHGSSNPEWRVPFDDIARQVQKQLHTQNSCARVRLAFLERMTPTMAQTIEELAQEGIYDIRIVPLFFGVGKHIQADLQQLILAAQSAHPQVNIQIAPALGQSEWMRAAMAQYAVRALDELSTN